MIEDKCIILGGEVGAYIEPYMDELCKRALKYDMFARNVNYLYPCTVRKHICSVGAARLILKKLGNQFIYTF
ncbi:hypothetical protein P261_00532 [Lachnospiraceae bacterium TWA4]|nr:hypothetical protein P261_00532 [Lachnospiraceae bacterium TWA4]